MASNPGAISDAETSRLRVPPHSLEAERSVLGGLMLDNASWDRVADRIREEDFYRRNHQLIFRAVASLIDGNEPCDVVTVNDWLESHGEVDAAGGLAYLGELAEGTPSSANVAAYCDIVRERALLREMIAAGSAIAGQGFRTAGRSVAELLEEAERRVYAIADLRRTGGGPEAIRDVLVDVMERIDELHQAGSHITGVPTGFMDLDERTAGLQNGDLIVVAGRPSMGKTAFALNLVESAALGAKQLPVVVFSMEMPSVQLTMRFMSSLARIDLHKIRTGKLDDADWPRLTTAMTMLNESKIFLDDGGALTPAELRARCRRLKREHGLGLVVVDYMQLMHVPGTTENRATELSEISRSLKALAREFEVPVVALSQLNRSLENRSKRRPLLSDLRESGAIEQDADVILFIYRDEVYNPESADRGKAEINIGKQRNGPTGTVNLAFLNHIAKFESFAPEYQ